MSRWSGEWSKPVEWGMTALLFIVSVLLGTLGNAIARPDVAPERTVVLTGTAFLVAGVALMILWLVARGRPLRSDIVSFGVFVTALVLLVATFFAAELRSILFRADILIWSESPFVTDIIKFRSGGTLYEAPPNLSSFNYTPGASFLTWLMAASVGAGDSIAAYRVVQVLYVVAAALLGVRAIGLLRSLYDGQRQTLPWTLAWFPLLFLAGTNTLTNPFNHLLHNDALGLLVCAAGFLLIVEYATRPRPALLVAMVLLPGAGFLVKQSLGIWCVIFGAWILISEKPMRLWRAVAVGGGGLVVVLMLYGGGLWLWGEDFRYWVIEGLGKHAVSPLRSIEHALQGWTFWAVGLAGGMVLVRGPRAPVLLTTWLVWAFLFAVETYTSGIAWMLNHMGPGSFLAVLWGAAALPSLWHLTRPDTEGAAWQWLRAGLVTALCLFSLSGLRSVRIPMPGLSFDADRYVSAIEREFEGLPPAAVLLDHGSWLYMAGGVVQLDRGAPAGEAGWTQTANFDDLFGRLRSHHYQRILVRDLHSPNFMYDYGLWERPSGVRDSLLYYYREVRQIPAVQGANGPWLQLVSVLEPRLAGDSASGPR